MWYMSGQTAHLQVTQWKKRCSISRLRVPRGQRRDHLSKETSVIHIKWPVRATSHLWAETWNGKHVQLAQGPYGSRLFPGNGVMKDGANTWIQAAHIPGCFTMQNQKTKKPKTNKNETTTTTKKQLLAGNPLEQEFIGTVWCWSLAEISFSLL